MDPKNNANPAAPDEQNTTPQTDAPQDAMPSLGNETVQGTDVGNGRPATGTPSVDASADTEDAMTPATPDVTTEPPKVAAEDSTESSAAPESPASPPSMSTEPTDSSSMPSTPSDAGTPTAVPQDQPVPSEPVPPVAPTPTPNNDKKTIMILGVVAAVLLVAIAVLYFVV
jgi:hypothetical protein